MASPDVSRTTPAILEACCAHAADIDVSTASAVNRDNRRTVRRREVTAVKDASSRFSRRVTVLRYSCVNLRRPLTGVKQSLGDNWVTMRRNSKKLKATVSFVILAGLGASAQPPPSTPV